MVNQLHLFNENTRSWFSEICESLEIEDLINWPDKFGNKINKWLSTNKKINIRTLSLFSGGGGLDIAFHDAGFDIVEMVEFEEKFIYTLRKNIGEGKKFDKSKANHVDIREYYPKFDEPIDFIIGGPPCQTFSSAGRRASGVDGTTESRGMLFWEYVRLLKEIKPKGFLFENVYGIVGSRGGEDWKIILDAFESAGYRIFYRILDAADYGVPQHRERLIIVGSKDDEFVFPIPTHGPDSPGNNNFYSAKGALNDVIRSEDINTLKIKGRFGHLLDDIPPGLNYSFYTEKMKHPKPIFAWRSKFSDYLYKADPEQPVRTIKASGGQYTGPFHWKNRRFTVAEIKRLQTFPDDYAIVGGRGIILKQIGNSVPPQFGRMLALAVANQIFNVQLPFQMQYLSPTKKLGFRSRKLKRNKEYQRKAKQALATSSNIKSVNDHVSRKYYGLLGDNFEWEELPKSLNENCLTVKFVSSPDFWKIRIVDRDKTVKKLRIKIVIKSNNGARWNLGVKFVQLESNVLSKKVFTSLWKAFETELSKGGYKADIVQLNGYYQYKPNIFMTMSITPDESNEKVWKMVKKVVEGVGVRRTITEDELAELWDMKADEIIDMGHYLRELGFEIRNWNTNSQILLNNYLIPYAFPTLTSQSVQLRKRL